MSTGMVVDPGTVTGTGSDPGPRRTRVRAGFVERWLDNPVFVKHVRSRLRRSQVVPSAAVVVVLCLCALYGGHVTGTLESGGIFGLIVGLQGVLLAIIGATQVASAVGGARESGILDFHRVSPSSPASVALGFFFGAPIREYLLFALTLPFALICVAFGAPTFLGFLQVMAALLLSAWLVHAVSLFFALASKKPKSASKAVVGLMIFLFVFGGQVGVIGVWRVSSLLDASPRVPIFGVPLPWLVSVVLDEGVVLAFLMIASCRKMRSDRAHALSKPEAIACLGSIGVMVLGGVWSLAGAPFLTLPYLYALAALACVMAVTMTPTLGEFAKWARRAIRSGAAAPRLAPWDDLALNRVGLVALGAILLVLATIAWQAVELRVVDDPILPQFRLPVAPDYSRSIAVAVLSVVGFGLVCQAAHLRYPRRATSLIGLFVFFAWGIPLILGVILSVANAGEDTSIVIAALSPVFGIGVASNIRGASDPTPFQAAALIPPLVFALLFNNLVTSARRRALRDLHAETPKPLKPGGEADLLLA